MGDVHDSEVVSVKVKRTERGWGGHFCLGQYCRFRRNTLLEAGDTRLVISTVGNCYPPSVKDEDTPYVLSYGLVSGKAVYETKIFHAQKEGPYWDADVGKEVSSPIDRYVYVGKDGPWEGIDEDANDMHERTVKQFQRELAKCETFPVTEEEEYEW